MQIPFRTLLFAVLLNAGLPTSSLAACADYEAQVNQAMTNLDFDTLEELLPGLNSEQAACPVSYLESVKRGMAQIAAAKADVLMQQGELAQAEAWLKRAPTMVWNTSLVHGNINAQREQWAMAVQFFNQALDLINDPGATPQAPTQAEIENIYQLVSVAQSLLEESDVIALRVIVRGVPRRRLVPILFDSGSTKLNGRGERLVKQLAKNIKHRNSTRVTLYGHSDPKGSNAACDRVSRRRAKVVKNSLRNAGVKSRIDVKGVGKRQPLRLANRWKLSKSKINALSRRVEFRINK
ncbi:MAG: hypothetical protein DRQ49_13220 [Gammaproteobacteria bacterium]|nr:MAG: hypothetical protein DRQ49_13220 [Gammaproteobacteria bacterium]RKZ40884.1 MAG: hypothetical protein DRQ41_08895 [Gammaproteobacteria bacterium]RKZ73513.1 MAG: hypothetical protein DRQ57_14135 [Gammaproteobacteria bacterium]